MGHDAKVLLRALLMIAAAVGLFAVAPSIMRDGSRLWMALVVLAVALIIRALWDTWELDAPLAIALVVSLAFGGMAFAAWSSVTEPDAVFPRPLDETEALRIRAMIFAGAGGVGGLIAAWRARRVLRD